MSTKKKIFLKICATPAPLMSQNCTRLEEKISQNVLKAEA